MTTDTPAPEQFEYPCYGCGTTIDVHELGCRYSEYDIESIRKSYIDILSPLSVSPHTKDELEETVHGAWTSRNEQALRVLKDRGRVTTETEDGRRRLVLRTAQEYLEQASPSDGSGSMATLWNHGPVTGGLNDGMFAAVAWFADRGFSWETTETRVKEWLDDTGAWKNEDWEQPTLDALLADYKHVHEEGYKPYSHAQSAVSTIEDTN